MPITTATIPLQTAMFQILNADTLIKTRPKIPGETLTIQDNVRPNNPFPYIVIGDFVENNESTFNKDGRMIEATLHIYSRYLGWLEAQTIASDLIRLLNKNLTLLNPASGMYVAMANYKNAVGQAEPSDLGYIVRHIPVRFEYLVMET